MGVLARRGDAHDPYFQGPRFLGIPRWRFRTAVTGLVATLAGRFTRKDPARIFAGELTAREYGGMLYGRHFFGRSHGQAGMGRSATPATEP
jgi:hypothetical protein